MQNRDFLNCTSHWSGLELEFLAMVVLKVLKKILILFVPLFVALGAGWYLRTDTEFFVVKDLKVDVEFQETQEALLISLKPDVEKSLIGLRGQNIWKVGLKRLQKQVEENPWIKELELERRFPDKIYALVRLEPVAFLFVDKKNRIYPVLENGKKMSVTKASLVPPAPILRNNNIVKDPVLLEKVLKLYKEIPLVGPFKKGNIAKVDFNSVTGLTVELINQKVKVHLGQTKIQTKALQVLRVMDYLKSQNQKARVIDASFTKKVLVRPRKRS